jgi:acetyltransferase-like isoleucine patch superfamily enzyme
MKRNYLGYLAKYRWRELLMYSLDCAASFCNQQISTFFFRLRCLLRGVKSGTGARVWGRFLISKFPGSHISIGDDMVVMSNPRFYALNVYPQSIVRTLGRGASIVIGNGVGFNSITILARSKAITIGDRTMIGGNCQIMDTDFHPIWPPSKRWEYTGDALDQPVHIGKNVFIGLDVLVLKGVTIGDNSVIAAGSVVNRSIPANCLAAGVPARVVKTFGSPPERDHD